MSLSFDIAITTYKRPNYVVAAVKSCLSQGKHLSNVIVVDDASNDNTGERLAALRDNRIIYHLRDQNGGIGPARRDAFSLCRADWTIMLDSDHELLPDAVEKLSAAAGAANSDIGILGGRFLWDNHKVSPLILPRQPIDYRGRITWCERPDSIRNDYVCCISRRVRDKVQWAPLRGGMVDTLFHLDISAEAKAIFIPDCLALQKSDAPFGHTRQSTGGRFMRRKLDAENIVHICETILAKHSHALQKNGPRFYADIIQTGAYYAMLDGQKHKSFAWLIESVRYKGLNLSALGILTGISCGTTLFRSLYFFRDRFRLAE